MMNSLGVIEGFYGKVWSWQERREMVDFLSATGFSSYWYAPKADRKLRKDWHENWDSDTFADLLALSAYCESKGICFGIGLSPLGLYESWRNGGGRDELQRRLYQIRQLKPGCLALLFDDMQGNLPALAQTQSDIAHFVAANIDVARLALCPSYYSFDPILEQLFGKMPDNYWSDLGRLLDPVIDIFWTGDKVISQDYPLAGLETITRLFRRKPLIWDNSIVNDGRKTSPFLTVRSMFDPSAFAGSISGLIVNPMNAPYLSRIPLFTLNAKGSPDERFLEALNQQAHPMIKAIQDCLELFSVKGRDALTDADKAKLERYFRHSDHPVARDIMAWLEGAYQFDPACLT